MKLFYSFTISLLSVFGYSQTILYQSETTTRTVQDPQTVVMAPGFKATSGISNPFVAKIGPGTENPGGGPTDSQAGANNPSGTPPDQVFHDTKGNIEVNGTGQLQFTLPIALPPGVKSVSPNMSLIYLSNSGNGIAGFGWALSGVTTISRTGKNIEKDGELTSVKLNYSDYYSFNGQRLILKSGEYGKDGAEYVTEKYSNVKIRSVGTISGQAWQGPEYWEVNFEDGSQAWYGATASGNSTARTPLEYNIVKWKDVQGNYIKYNYIQPTSTNVSSVSTIQWGGNEILNKPAINELIFNYNQRNLFEQNFVNGIALVQDRILNNIVVKTNNNLYNKYVIEYVNNGTSYQFVSKITTYNSEEIAANPITFDYPQSAPSTVDPDYLQNEDPFSGVKLTGDFNGDSYIDFVMSNGTVKLGAFNNDTFTTIATNKYFDTEAKVVNSLLDEEGQVYNGNGIVQFEEGKIVGYIFRNNAFVKVFEKLVYDSSNCTYQGGGVGCTIKVNSLNEGDLNGDGISDIFLSLSRRECQFVPSNNLNATSNNEDIVNRPPPGYELECNTYSIGNFIVDLKNSNNPLSTYVLDSGLNDSQYYNQQYMDIDGDGKVEIINVSNNDYKVFEFVKTASNQYLKKIRYTSNLVETKDPEFPVLYGDFNGDGKLDFTIPVTDNAVGKPDNWRFYIGTGTGFNNFLKTEFLTYKKRQTEVTSSYTKFARQYFFAIADMNKDGKSDVVQVFSYNQVNNFSAQGYRDFGYVVNVKLANGTAQDGTLNFESGLSFVSPTYAVQDIQDLTLFTPLTNSIKANNNYYNVFLYWKKYLHRIKAPSPLSELARVKSINQGNGSIITNILYAEAVPNVNNIYKKIKKEFYPYFSLERIDQTFVVSQLQQVGRKQDFRYRGMTAHMQGRGSIGYYQVARSSWYADGFENTKIWSGIEIDPLQEGVPVKEWSIRTNDESKIFPSDISENNTLLLSFKSTTYQTDKLLSGQVVTTVADADKPKVVTAMVPKSSKTKDFSTGTLATSNITYGDYYLPSQTISNVNNGYAISTSTFEYIHNPSGVGANYFIGRPKSKTDIAQAYGDTKSSKEEYTYENNQLKTLKSWNRDNTGYLLETYNYDSFGNLTQKTIGNSIDSQTQTVKTNYDDKGRFVIKKTDNLGLETNITYNNWGQILTQTDPLGNVLTNTYDNWGKILKSKTNLGGTTTYQYERDSNSNIIVTQNDPDGDISKKYTNKLGQDYKASTKAFGQGQYVSKTTIYDILGRKIRESEPYFEGQSPSQWNVLTYDDTVFPPKVTATALAKINTQNEISSFTGKRLITTVSGLTTTIKEDNGYGRTTSKTTDALGNVVSSTDKGGTIQFTFNAAGEQIKAQYAENIVTTKYDVWGRKAEFNDPSNGLYKYEYDGFGQPKKIISPKGTKEYTYNNLGQIVTQKELSTSDSGQATNKTITYSYDNKGRVISKSGTSKGKSYSSNVSYDPQGRVLSSSESSNGKYFIQKGITYDDKARVISYEKQLYSSGAVTKVQIENMYSAWNGELYQVKDKNSGKILWELKETNTRGQVSKAKLGAADVNNMYDENGFLTNVNHSSQVKTDILQIHYSFDGIKNELRNRTTGGDFSINETFDYDDNNRLINWTNPVTGVKVQNAKLNVYDAKGRILENDQVGKIKFENSAKIYQPTGMTLNAEGTQNYNNDLIQSIVYNENNDPVFIDGEKGDVAFQYGLTAMRQRVTYGGNFSSDGDGKFTKFYSEDGSFEVVKDNTTGKEKHILYIGGSPYESNIVYLKNFEESSGSYKFLHKDYIGSILAISDEAGNKLEQRHFDAWGNFTHLKIGNGAIITDKNIINNTSLLLERGYTSHEHFAEVGIIHMNGRLYDPLLRRFLNADENIQDPYNTQIYNKYGYALNNPLIYNDPSGEVLPFLVGVGLGSFWATVISGAIIGAVVSSGLYVVKSVVTGNWSWGGFAKSLLLGAVTGAATGGLTGGMSASSFQGAVIIGSMNGGIAGGIDALFNGQNFFTGLYKGAVFGGAVAGVSYMITFLSNAKVHKLREVDLNLSNTETSSTITSTDPEVLNERIQTFRKNNYTPYEIQRFGVAADKLDVSSINNLGGYMKGGVIAETRPNFLTNTSDIIYSSRAANIPYLLGKTMAHETAHAYVNKLTRFIFFSGNRKRSELEDIRLDTAEHLAIKKLENTYYQINLNGVDQKGLNIIPLDSINKTINGLSPEMQAQVKSWTEKLFDVFNRKVTYQGISW